MAFGLVWTGGEEVRGRPIEERRDRLEGVLGRIPGPIHLSERLNESLEGALAEAKRRGLEGVVAKRRGSVYRGGRSSDWLKIKVSQAQEVVIVGYTPISTGSNEI